MSRVRIVCKNCNSSFEINTKWEETKCPGCGKIINLDPKYSKTGTKIVRKFDPFANMTPEEQKKYEIAIVITSIVFMLIVSLGLFYGLAVQPGHFEEILNTADSFEKYYSLSLIAFMFLFVGYMFGGVLCGYFMCRKINHFFLGIALASFFTVIIPAICLIIVLWLSCVCGLFAFIYYFFKCIGYLIEFIFFNPKRKRKKKKA